MPKFSGVNSKSLEARQRKQQIEQEKLQAKREAELDEYWKDDDKKIQSKLNRKMEKSKKAEDKLQKKAELKQLIEKEDEEISSISRRSSRSDSSVNKVTRADIIKNTMLARAMAKKEEKEADYHVPLEPNINHERIKEEMENEGLEIIDVSGIDAALTSLSIDNNVDMHPEKRMKAAYTAFESSLLPQVKAEYPNLKLSQYKNIIQKMWKKSPLNPMNN